MAFISNMTTTWNNVATIFNAIKMTVTNTASADGSNWINIVDSHFSSTRPVLQFQKTGTNEFTLALDGVSNGSFECWYNAERRSTFTAYGLSMNTDGVIKWSQNASNAVSTTGLVLARDADNTLAQRNSTNAQTFRIYNTFTDASNYERINLYWNSNTATLESANAGTGSARNLLIQAASGGATIVGRFGADALYLDAGNIYARATLNFLSDNTYDIGASGANRPRDVFIARNLWVANAILGSGTIESGSGSPHSWNGASAMYSPSDGVIKLANNANNGFSLLQFGGTTSSFPALKRSSANLQVRLADDSAYTQLTADSFLAITDNLGYGFGAGNRMVTGTGSPNGSLSRAKGSLYLRLDGSGVNDRAYINTDGGTTWTAIVTVA